VIIRLQAQSDGNISPTQGHRAYALLLDLVSASSRKLSEELHGSDIAKPFTISPLFGRLKSNLNRIEITAGNEYNLRLTFLREDVFAHFMDASYRCSGKNLRLETIPFKLQHVLFNHKESNLCMVSSYEQLYYSKPYLNRIRLKFFSPTTFRSRGKRNVLVPEPALVFGSYFNKWQRFSPLKFDPVLVNNFAAILLGRHRLKTYILHFTDYQETGFEGECVYELPAKLDDKTTQAINALSDFAFFCGTGAKTTMGMGQTRKI